MVLIESLKDALCRRWLRRRGIKFSSSLRELGSRSQLVLEPGVAIREVRMDFGRLEVGAMSYIRGECELLNVSRIGRFCSIGNGVLIGQDRAGHPLHWVSSHPFAHDLGKFRYNPERVPTIIGHDVWIGRDAMIMEGVSVGTGAVIAARALVTHDVPPYAIVAGAPARVIRYRHDEKLIAELLASEWWRMPIENLLRLPLDQPQVFIQALKIASAVAPAQYSKVMLRRGGWMEMNEPES